MDETAEKEIFEAVEKEMIDEPIADVETETTDKFQRLNLFFENETVTLIYCNRQKILNFICIFFFQISSAEVQSRQEYLRAQRDKILEIKKKARSYQLNESVKKNGRPSSAQAAQNILKDGSHGIENDAESNLASLQLRKTLARRLRTEVVGNQQILIFFFAVNIFLLIYFLVNFKTINIKCFFFTFKKIICTNIYVNWLSSHYDENYRKIINIFVGKKNRLANFW